MGYVDYLENLHARHREFFRCSTVGDLLVFSNCWRAGSADFNFGDWKGGQTSFEPIIDLPSPLSEDFLRAHAFDMGREAAREARLIAEFHYDCVQDDWCPAILFHPGAGYEAAMSTGGELRFTIGTDHYGGSYTTSHVIQDINQMEKAFNHQNRWIDYALEFWKGVESEDIRGLTVTPRYNRTPLDIAWDLRGDRIFYDFYDYPEETDKLLALCAESIIEIDKILRSESRLLREQPGGVQGVAFTDPTMILNGDPLDIISDDFIRRFSNLPMERVTAYSKATMLHHHSIGISKAGIVAEIPGLTVQEVYQDPNGPKIAESVSDDLIAASLKTPIMLEFPVVDADGNFNALVERLALGRFIIHLFTESAEEAKTYIAKLRSVSSF